MKLRLLFAALLATVAWSTTATAADKLSGCYTFVLDCSKSMEQPAVAEDGPQQVSHGEDPTRMEVAQLILRKMLRDLAAGGKSEVSLWLYGHRLVWEAEVKQPELLSQDEYLEATVGFDALKELLPGDDVECAHAFKRLDETEFERIAMRLNVVKPWGEKPLYLTLLKALEAMSERPAGVPKAIVVLTDGGNDQWLARYKTSSERVTKELARNIVPIHVIHLGPATDPVEAAEQELQDLAEQGGGRVVHVGAKTELTLAQVLATSRKVVPQTVSTSADEEAESETAEADVAARDVDPEVASKIAAAKKLLIPKPAGDRTISGSVLYYGKPAMSATVTLEGSGIPAVKTDRKGQFLIRKVPAGKTYKVMVKAIAKNSFREKTVELNVDADEAEVPFMAIDLSVR